MAPEVCLKQPYTEKVDVFSFAVVAWTMARNKLPYRGFSTADHMQRVVMNGERPKLESGWPIEFRNLLQACWHPIPEMRPGFDVVSETLALMVDRGGAKQSTSMLRKIGNTLLTGNK